MGACQGRGPTAPLAACACKPGALKCLPGSARGPADKGLPPACPTPPASPCGAQGVLGVQDAACLTAPPAASNCPALTGARPAQGRCPAQPRRHALCCCHVAVGFEAKAQRGMLCMATCLCMSSTSLCLLNGYVLARGCALTLGVSLIGAGTLCGAAEAVRPDLCHRSRCKGKGRCQGSP